MQRLLPPVLMLTLALTATALHIVVEPLWPELAVAAPAVRWLGLPLGATGLGMSVWGSRRFGEVGTNIQTFDRPDVLVSDGLFAWSRNPMYLGFLLVLMGLAIGLGSWIGLVAPVCFFFAANQWYIPYEETLMHQTFEQQYEDYASHVRRWLGRRDRTAR